MTKRQIQPLSWADIKPPDISIQRIPEMRMVNPRTLLVDETYQRDIALRSRSGKLLRRIVAGWDWTRFKPPICAETPDGLEVIDGQHTATAAASHPEIVAIPVMVVQSPSVAQRADAFVGHNRDRINVTGMQVYYAMLAALDPHALAIQRVCKLAGIKLLKVPPGRPFLPGETQAIKTISGFVNQYGEDGAYIMLKAAADSNLAPVSVVELKAIEMLTHTKEYKGKVTIAQITEAFNALGLDAAKETRIFAATHDIELWRALGIVLYRETRKPRRKAA